MNTIKSLRVLRVLRPLKTIKRIPKLKVIFFSNSDFSLVYIMINGTMVLTKITEPYFRRLKLKHIIDSINIFLEYFLIPFSHFYSFFYFINSLIIKISSKK